MRKMKKCRLSRTHGFSLVELIMVVLIIGLVAGWSIPSYTKSIESSKADEAVSLLRTIASAYRNYETNHGTNFYSIYMTGRFGSAAPGSCGTGTQHEPWQLIACAYMSNQNWSSMAYDFYACEPLTQNLNGVGGCGCAPYVIVSACRKTGEAPGTNASPYKKWGYRVDMDGNVNSFNEAPQP